MSGVIAGMQPWTLDAAKQIIHERAAFGEPWRFVSGTHALARALALLQPDWVFFLHWSDRVATDILEGFTCVNMHCAPLPYGRGGHPIENMLLRGHTETTITAHRMTRAFDAGPIYGTRRPVSLAGTKVEILARFVEPCADLMRWILENRPEPQPQVGEPVVFSRLTPDAYQQFWSSRG